MKLEKYILHIASWLPNDIRKYEANFIQNQIEVISENYKSITLHIAEGADTDCLENIVNKNNITYLKYIRKSKNMLKYFFQLWNLYSYIIKKHGEPILTHVHVSFRAAFAARIGKLLFNRKYIVTEHFTALTKESNHPNKRTITRFTKFFSKGAEKTIVVSKYLKNELIKNGFSKVEVIPNFINTSLFYYEVNNIQDSKIKFIHISNLKECQKNVKGIIRAFDKCNEYDFELSIIGSDNDTLERLKSWATKFSVINKINFFPAMSQKDLGIMIRKHDCLVMFSNFETFSIVIIEALASGLYVIATDIGGPIELITNENRGILVEVGNEIQLINAIKNVINGTNKVSKEEALMISDEYGREKFKERMAKVYSEII